MRPSGRGEAMRPWVPAALVLLVVATPVLAAETRYFDMVAHMSCRVVSGGGGFDSGGPYHTYCSNGRYEPSFVDARVSDVVIVHPGDARYGAGTSGYRICPDRYWLPMTIGTHVVECDYPTAPGSRDPGVARGTVVVTGPKVVVTERPAELANVTGVVRIAGTASDGKGLDAVEYRVDGGAWQTLVSTSATTTPWTLDLDTWPLLRGTRTVQVRALSGWDDNVHTVTMKVVVANPPGGELRAHLRYGPGFMSDELPEPYVLVPTDPAVRFVASGFTNHAATFTVVGEMQRDGLWHTVLERTVTKTGAFSQEWLVDLPVAPDEYGTWPVRLTVDEGAAVGERDESDNVDVARFFQTAPTAPGRLPSG